jgi:sec-independent protein translocase protein TatC
MTLRQHLGELRNRLFAVAIAVAVATIAGWFLSDPVWSALRAPVEQIAHAQSRLATINYPSITSAFDLRLQTAFLIGVALSCPVWLYEAFAFILPGLKRRERMRSVAFVAAAVPLFAVGCAAGWFVLPHIVELMTSFAPKQTSTFIDASTYFTFVLKLVLATGVAFILPLFLLLLNVLGVLKGRTILRSWRLAVVAIAVFTAIATPAADVMSMFVLAVPMLVLFFGATCLALGHDRVIGRREQRILETA